MRIIPAKTALLIMIVLSVALLAMELYRSASKRPETAKDASRDTVRQLAPDVENVLQGYAYSEESDDLKIRISGKRIIRRGKQVLGLRSNLVKTNFLQGIEGTLKTSKATVEFAATTAEWDADPSHPFMLKEGPRVRIDGKEISGLKKANIYFAQGVVQTTAGDTDKRETFHFR